MLEKGNGVMPAIYTCDICGAPDASEDYDGRILCTYHRAEYELKSLKGVYREKRDWVKRIHLAELAKMRYEISRLERVIAENKPKEEA
jgi:uncharacterized Zn finger protein (UPF0148 family)